MPKHSFIANTMEYVDEVTGTWSDLDGIPHLLDPIAFIRMQSEFQGANEVVRAIAPRVQELPAERMMIKKKYQEVADVVGEKQPTGSGKSSGSGKGSGKASGAGSTKGSGPAIEKFLFNPMKSRR